LKLPVPADQQIITLDMALPILRAQAEAGSERAQELLERLMEALQSVGLSPNEED
jgi:hypothetical protein